MISKTLSRRLERLEDSLLPVNEDPVSFVIVAVTSDSQIAGRFPLIPGGLQRLSADQDVRKPAIHDAGFPIEGI